jgi:pimeloyl-ACP methyl ester carboxylesterase
MAVDFSEGYVDAKGRRLHYAKWGSEGPNLLLVHSMGMDCHSMDALCEALQDEYRILSLTILGHGDSEVPEKVPMLPEHAEVVREAARKLGYAPYTLIGHSIGGMMGMILAAEHPGEVQRLVLVDIAPFEMSRTGRPSRPPPPERFANEAEALRYLKERFPGFTDYYYENRLLYAFRKDGGALRLKPMGDSIRDGMNVDLWPYVERIRVSTLLLAGETGIVTAEAETRMKKLVPGLKVAKVLGTGHMIPQDKPEEFEKLVREFLKN